MYGGGGGGGMGMGMGMVGGGGMWRRMNATDEKPQISWKLLRRALAYARPYRWKIAGMLFIIVVTSGLGLVSPLIMRSLIDDALPNRNLNQLIWLTLALLFIPVFS